MAGREFRVHAEIAAELAIDHDPAAQAKRSQDIVENVDRRSPSAYVCGVSINLSGTPIILANGRLA
jgi:hypothetical protein